ncbi:MAG TPA: OsmC family peroxiredoxin [Acholeplasmataceae bacterium]|nr:OsmC family peroxiredoxin [Acholeplasmataceae bacterium]
MAVENIVLNFSNSFSGKMIAPNGEVNIGKEELRPYNLLLGALGSCFYATFLDIVKKKRLSFSEASITISGNKREKVPTTLETVEMDFVIKGVEKENQDKFIKSAELGAKYCSIHETISKVANIKLNVRFE